LKPKRNKKIETKFISETKISLISVICIDTLQDQYWY